MAIDGRQYGAGNTYTAYESDNQKVKRLEDEVSDLLKYLGISANDWQLAKDAPCRVSRALTLSGKKVTHGNQT